MASSDEEGLQVGCAVLDALLELSQEMPAGIGPANFFASSGALLVLLGLFFKVKLPSFGEESGEALAGSEAKRQEVRVVVAQTLGQLLLASAGVERRTKLQRDLHLTQGLGVSSGVGLGLGEDVTDMYDLLGLLEPGASPQDDEPHVVQTLYLLLPLALLSQLARDPAGACALLEEERSSPLFVWDRGALARCQWVIREELEAVKSSLSEESQGEARGLPPWSLSWGDGRPKFLGYVPACAPENVPLTSKEAETVAVACPPAVDSPLNSSVDEGSGSEEKTFLVRQLYLSGFFVDAFLFAPYFELSPIMEERLVREVRKMVVVAAPSHGARARDFDFDDRRRLLLTLLLLYRLRQGEGSGLLGGASLDIFLPVYDFINGEGGSGEERRGLTQPGLLLFHCAVTGRDAAEFVVSEDLLYSLERLLGLRVPAEAEGDPGTDPRLCALTLLLRLVRVSSKAAKLALECGTLPHVASLLKEASTALAVRAKAAEVLAAMAADRKVGAEVLRALGKVLPPGSQGHGAWNVPSDEIRDEPLEERTLRHFLTHRMPASWWGEGFKEATLEAIVKFAEGSSGDFEREGEAVFAHSIGSSAQVDARSVRLLRALGGGEGVRVEFEIRFTKAVIGGVTREAKEAALDFKAKLERQPTEVFGGTFFERLGDVGVVIVTVREE